MLVAALPSPSHVPHLIAPLPGWRGPLPSRQWSGYINISEAMGTDMRVHYWYIESEGSPEADPLLVWTNGGPSASSMFGLLVELGPLLLNDESVQTAEYGRGRTDDVLQPSQLVAAWRLAHVRLAAAGRLLERRSALSSDRRKIIVKVQSIFILTYRIDVDFVKLAVKFAMKSKS